MSSFFNGNPWWNPQPQPTQPSNNNGDFWGRMLAPYKSPNTNMDLGEDEDFNSFWSSLLGNNNHQQQFPIRTDFNIPQQGTTLSSLFNNNNQNYLGYNDAMFDGEDDDNWWTYY